MNRRKKERAFVVGLDTAGNSRDETISSSLDELAMLTAVAGGEVLLRYSQRRKTPEPAFFIGKGKVEEIRRDAEIHRPDIIIFNNELSFVQVKNLEHAFDCKVIDRSELILDIFALRARTRQARLSVELAQLEYQLPRLKRMWTHLSRIEGGIGTRGPGEKQLETDRRIARRQIERYKTRLRKIEDHIERSIHSRTSEFTVALVGYTNTGKSTLMQKLSGKNVLVRDELFATIDTRTARVELGGGHTFLLSDTVGFIDNIPHDLIESFKATLMHAREADLLLHVIDSSSPVMEKRMRIVDEILEEIGCGDKNIIRVFNKTDICPDLVPVRDIASVYSDPVFISARKKKDIEILSDSIRKAVRNSRRTVLVRIPLSDGKLIARVKGAAEIRQSDYTTTHAVMEVSAPPDMLHLLETKGLLMDDEETAINTTGM